MQRVEHKKDGTWTIYVILLLLTSLLCLPVTAGESTVTGAISLPHSQAETDAVVENLSSDQPAVVLATLKTAKGILRRDFKKRVYTLLTHRDPEVQSAAFEFVLPCEIREAYTRLADRLSGQFPGPIDRNVCIPESETELRDPSGPVVRQFELLGKAAIGVLTQKLKAPIPEHRIFAIHLLAKTGSPEAVPAIKGMLRDPEPAVRRRAVRALGTICDKEALDALCALADDKDSQLARTVAIALSQARDDRALAVWQALLRRDNGDYAAHHAAEWISHFNRQKAIPILIDGLGHSQVYIRRDCLETLRRLTRKDYGEDQTLWKKWWSAACGQETYNILGEALRTEKNSKALMAIVNEGDTRAIQYVLENYGNIRIATDICNEHVDSSWALRILSAQSLPLPTDHIYAQFKDDAGQIELWRRWYDAHKDTMPCRCPLIDPYRPLKEVSRLSVASCAEHVSIDGHLMFVGGRGHLEVFDISNAAEPERVGRYSVREQGVAQITSRDGRLFLATFEGFCHVYRYTPQGDFQFVSTCSEVKYGLVHFMLLDKRLMVGNHVLMNSAKAALYDISGDGAPTLLDVRDGKDLAPFSLCGERGFFTTADWHGDRIVTNGCCPIAKIQKRVWPGGTALADDGRFYCINHGLLIVRDIHTGKLLGSAPARAPYNAALVVRGRRAYAALESMGIVIYDVSDPGGITVLSHTPLPGQPRAMYRGLCVEKNHLFCANYEGDLFIFELPESLAPQPVE